MKLNQDLDEVVQGCEGERREGRKFTIKACKDVVKVKEGKGKKCTIKDVKVNSCKNVKVKDEGAKKRRAKGSEKQESSRARI